MKPRLRARIDGGYFPLHDLYLSKSGWRDPSVAIFSIANPERRYSDAFANYEQVKVDIEYQDEMLKGMEEWQNIFSGFADVVEEGILNARSLLTFECRCNLRILQDDAVTTKWESVYLHTFLKELVGKQFTLKLDVPNFYIGDHIMEQKSRLEEINDFAELFGCITYLKGNELYFGEYRKGKAWIYQFLFNYPRDRHLVNANIEDFSHRRMVGGFPYHKVVVKKVNEEKTVFRGEATSMIKKHAGQGKILDIDHKYLTSDDMADRLAKQVLWKQERLYQTVNLRTFGVPFLEPEWVIEVANIGEANSGFYWLSSVVTTYTGGENQGEFYSNITANTRDPKERFVK